MESHYTATGFVLNQAGNKALVIFHKKLQFWLPAGGHVDEGELPHEAVIREVFEETGVRAHIISASKDLALHEGSEIQLPCPFFVLHEFIPQYKDKPAHMHYDFLYRMQAESDECMLNKAECESVEWFSKEQLLTTKTTEATRKIYGLLLDNNR